MKMNFNEIGLTAEDGNDFERLMKLCNSYGLNEEETDQIIRDFKNGSLLGNDQSIEESFQQSFRELDCSPNERSKREHNEEYSFKHQNANIDQFSHQISHHHMNSQLIDSLEEKSDFRDQQKGFYRRQNKIKSGGEKNLFEQFLKERREFENNIYTKLEQENIRLKEELKEKNDKIQLFLKMKVQDSEIILGLKEVISTMTKTIQDKELYNKQLFEKYQKAQKNISQQQENLRYLQQIQPRQSKISHQDSVPDFEQEQRRKSITPTLKQNHGYDNSKRIEKKASQKFLRESSSKQLRENKQNNKEKGHQYYQYLKQEKNRKKNRIDIGKYKGMIQQLRNSYCKFR